MWTPEMAQQLRLTLVAVAVLVTAASALGAGVTTAGLLTRAGLAGTGFWMIGTGLGRLIAWCAVPARQQGLGHGGAAHGETARHTSGGKGQTLDVTLPAIQPTDENGASMDGF